jgi:hypothetical protein
MAFFDDPDGRPLALMSEVVKGGTTTRTGARPVLIALSVRRID